MLNSILSSISLMALEGAMNPLAATHLYSCVGIRLLFSLLFIVRRDLTEIIAQCISSSIFQL